MKKLTDEEIQKLLEQNLNIPGDELGDNDDVKAYQLLFDGLKQEPETGLPYNFAKKVVGQIQSAKNRRQDVKLYWLMGVAVILMFITAAVFMAAYNYTDTIKLVSVLNTYKWIIVFVVVVILGVQYFDQRLVRKVKGLV
jgi:hypothetical protein